MVNKTEFINSVTRTFHKVGFELKKHSPEILVVTGTVGVVASAILACKATTKLNAILDESKQNIELIRGSVNNPALPEPYTEEDSKKDLTIVYAQTGLKLAKLYAPSVLLGAASIGCILTSHGIIRKRNVALAAAYTTVDRSFKEYRGRVVERFGEELDKELRFNIKAQEIEEKVVNENGEEKTVKKTIQVADMENCYSEYARCYDDGCIGWQKDSEQNLWFLIQQQNWANEKLKAKGHLFLNEVYEMLGIPKSVAGQVVGWRYDPKNPNHKGDNYIDFGIHDLTKRGSRDFVNGYEKTVWLDFNVDGNIMNDVCAL